MNEISFAGVDLTPRVVSWANLEEIKTILLGQASMFTSEISLTLSNLDGAFDPDGPSSLIAGIDWYGTPFTITQDNERKTTVVHEYAFTNYSHEGLFRYNNLSQGIGQTVTPPARPFDCVDIELRKWGSPVGYVWLEWQGASAGLPDRVVHAVSNRVRAERLGTGLHDVQRFRFPQPIHPDGVSQYAWALMSDVPISTTNYIRIGWDQTAPTYAGGTLLRLESGAWVAYAGYDCLFELRAFDHIVLFEGVVTNIPAGEKKQDVVITAENVLKVVAETVFVGNGTAVNPAAAILGMLRTVLDDDDIDVASFTAAGEHARAAAASITYRYTDEDDTTIMAVIEAIANLCSLVVYAHDNKITCQRFRAYPGSEADLKFEITDSFVRRWGKFKYDVSSFDNAVAIGYTTDDLITRTNPESIRKNKVTRKAEFDGSDQLVASSQHSAIYFADRYLERASHRRAMLSVAGGKEFEDVRLGDRFPVTATGYRLSRFPMEAIRVNRKLGTEDVELTLVELVPQ